MIIVTYLGSDVHAGRYEGFSHCCRNMVVVQQLHTCTYYGCVCTSFLQSVSLRFYLNADQSRVFFFFFLRNVRGPNQSQTFCFVFNGWCFPFFFEVSFFFLYVRTHRGYHRAPRGGPDKRKLLLWLLNETLRVRHQPGFYNTGIIRGRRPERIDVFFFCRCFYRPHWNWTHLYPYGLWRVLMSGYFFFFFWKGMLKGGAWVVGSTALLVLTRADTTSLYGNTRVKREKMCTTPRPHKCWTDPSQIKSACTTGCFVVLVRNSVVPRVVSKLVAVSAP